MSYVTAHVLDASAGKPAEGILITLYGEDGSLVASETTNSDGRVTDFGPDFLEPGNYQIDFQTGGYFAARNQDTFYPWVTVHFTVVAGQAHYHVPLLLSPFAYSTYRGS